MQTALTYPKKKRPISRKEPPVAFAFVLHSAIPRSSGVEHSAVDAVDHDDKIDELRHVGFIGSRHAVTKQMVRESGNETLCQTALKDSARSFGARNVSSTSPAVDPQKLAQGELV